MIRSILACLLCMALAASCSSERATTPPTARDAAGAAHAEQDPPTTGAQQRPPPPSAGEPRTPPPPVEAAGGVLPLVQGVYVMGDGDCASPANAGVRFYDGRGISGTATHDCRATVRARDGAIHEVEQSCIDTPTGDGPRTSETQTITVHGARAFTLVTADESTRFRHCPADEIPGYLLERIAPDHDAG